MKSQIAIGASLVLLGVAILEASGQSVQNGAGTPKADVPTFTKDVAPILYENCVACHRPGEIAPMSLLTYKDARKWAKAIRDEVADGTMPPWHADPTHGRFANDRSLTAVEKETLAKWANGGALEGDEKDLPPAPRFAEGWQLGEPDTVLQLPVEYKVPADGFVEYEYFQVPTNFTEDKWLEGLEVRPGNRSVVHHVIVSTRPPQPERRPTGFRANRGMDIPPGQSGGEPEPEGAVKRARGQSLFPAPERRGAMIGGFAPGNQYLKLEPGSAILIRAGSTLVVQMHSAARFEEPLIWVRDFDPAFAETYWLRNPVEVGRGAQLLVAAAADGAAPCSVALTFAK